MHTIDIPQQVIDWCIARRGRVEIFDQIDPQKTALLAIDMQNSFFSPGLSTIGVPDLEAIVPNINRLAGATRQAGGIVIWTRQTYTPEWSSWYTLYATPDMRYRIVADTAPGAAGREIFAGMDVRDGDIDVVKKRSSALTPGSSDLQAILRDHGRDTLIITGTLSNVCCESTARDAMLLNFKTIFVADANAARSDAEHNATLVNMMQFFADVRTTDDVCRLLKGGVATRS